MVVTRSALLNHPRFLMGEEGQESTDDEGMEQSEEMALAVEQLSLMSMEASMRLSSSTSSFFLPLPMP